jgi:hypothetical protein
MNSIKILGSLILLNLVNTVFTQVLQSAYGVDSRDGYGRYDPNQLLNGFFPAWAILMLCIAGRIFVQTLFFNIFY